MIMFLIHYFIVVSIKYQKTYMMKPFTLLSVFTFQTRETFIPPGGYCSGDRRTESVDLVNSHNIVRCMLSDGLLTIPLVQPHRVCGIK